MRTRVTRHFNCCNSSQLRTQLVRHLSRRQLQAFLEALVANRHPGRMQRPWPVPPPLPVGRTACFTLATPQTDPWMTPADARDGA